MQVVFHRVGLPPPLWSGHTRKQSNSLVAVVHKQESRHKVPKSVLRAVLARMQFTLHTTRRTPHGASRLVQTMPAWVVKTLRAPSRNSRDARVYGHTTTAMHKQSTPPPPPSSPLSLGDRAVGVGSGIPSAKRRPKWALVNAHREDLHLRAPTPRPE